MMKNIISSNELKEGLDVMVIGSPNSSGQIEAKLIRVVPAPPAMPILNN